MFPTEMFATTTQWKILRVLAEKNKRYTIGELAEMTHRSEATISRALRHADRYPFIEKDHAPGSKQLIFRLNPDSRYTAAIRDFFQVEHDRERRNGTVPVDVWNLLEDVTEQFSENTDGFIELFLFGSYATGEYYAGSDIDLLLAHTPTDDIRGTIDTVAQKTGDNRLQVIPVVVDEDPDRLSDKNPLETIRAKAPIRNVDVLIPLSGEVSP